MSEIFYHYETRSSNLGKIACGALMVMPAYVAYSYFSRERDTESWSSMLYRGARHAGAMSVAAVLITTAEIGLFHIADGLYRLSPAICPRTN